MNAYTPYLDIYSITLACMLCATITVTWSCCDLLCLPARCQRCGSWLNYSCVNQHLKHVSQEVICCHWLESPSWLRHASYTSPLCLLLWCIHVQTLSMTVYALCKLLAAPLQKRLDKLQCTAGPHNALQALACCITQWLPCDSQCHKPWHGCQARHQHE